MHECDISYRHTDVHELPPHTLRSVSRNAQRCPGKLPTAPRLSRRRRRRKRRSGAPLPLLPRRRRKSDAHLRPRIETTLSSHRDCDHLPALLGGKEYRGALGRRCSSPHPLMAELQSSFGCGGLGRRQIRSFGCGGLGRRQSRSFECGGLGRRQSRRPRRRRRIEVVVHWGWYDGADVVC